MVCVTTVCATGAKGGSSAGRGFPSFGRAVGALWENFMFIERLKYRAHRPLHANVYFWCTYDRQEIDLVEEHGEKYHGYEFKWSEDRKVTAPKKWVNSYPDATYTLINPGNYQEFILE